MAKTLSKYQLKELATIDELKRHGDDAAARREIEKLPPAMQARFGIASAEPETPLKTTAQGQEHRKGRKWNQR